MYKTKLDKGITFRLLICIALTGITLGLFLVNKPTPSARKEDAQRDLKEIVGDLDRDVDTVLAHFGIEKQWVKRRQIDIPGTNLLRIERRVLVPENLLPVHMNVAFNAMAKQYDGRAVASENLKENLVTVHIELEGYVLQTIVLKPTRELPRLVPKVKQRKI